MSEDSEGTFRTHAQYVRAFAHIAGFTKPTERPHYRLSVVREKTESAPSIRLKRRSDADVEQVRLSLSNAWGTELLLALSGEFAVEEELVRVSNSWGVVQAYYALYHATQALMVSLGDPRSTTHPKTQRSYASFWTEREMVLPPWTMGASHDGYRNIPDEVTIDETFHPWSKCDKDSRWQIAAKALRTTRDEAIDEALQEARHVKAKKRVKTWKEEEATRAAAGLPPQKRPAERANLTRPERNTVHAHVRTYTILDYLYRLRIKANYEDVAVFTEGPTDDYSSRTVHLDLVHIVAAGLAVHELHIRQLIGVRQFENLAKTWVGANMPEGMDIGIGLRWRRLYT
jgi:hypothetical protein